MKNTYLETTTKIVTKTNRKSATTKVTVIAHVFCEKTMLLLGTGSQEFKTMGTKFYPKEVNAAGLAALNEAKEKAIQKRAEQKKG